MGGGVVDKLKVASYIVSPPLENNSLYDPVFNASIQFSVSLYAYLHDT